MRKTTLTDGSPVTPDHREIDPKTGMQKGYVVLSAEERAKGFVRPVRRSYVHVGCGTVTTMGRALAETYARDLRDVAPGGYLIYDSTWPRPALLRRDDETGEKTP